MRRHREGKFKGTDNFMELKERFDIRSEKKEVKVPVSVLRPCKMCGKAIESHLGYEVGYPDNILKCP